MSEEGEKIPLLPGAGSAPFHPFGRGGSPHTPILLLGGGGTGKTTTLLRIACGQDRRYTPASAAVYYISLYGYRDKEQNYICDRLLESLKFKPHTDSMESARRELIQLLDRPAGGRTLLLLDGLNEASGDTGPLLEEIARFSGLAGVQIILTSRTDPGLAGYRKLTLCRLEQEEVNHAAGHVYQDSAEQGTSGPARQPGSAHHRISRGHSGKRKKKSAAGKQLFHGL